MSKLRAELVLQHRKLGHGVVGNAYYRTRDVLAIVIYAVNGEIVVARTLAADRGAVTHTDSTPASDSSADQSQIVDATVRIGGHRQILSEPAFIRIGHLRCGRI